MLVRKGWFSPNEANGCCSPAVRDSWVRALTYSFGSICLGSLIVALIQAVKEMVHQARENGDSMLACCAECLIGCIEALVEVRLRDCSLFLLWLYPLTYASHCLRSIFFFDTSTLISGHSSTLASMVLVLWRAAKMSWLSFIPGTSFILLCETF
jgi:hypothetical protein